MDQGICAGWIAGGSVPCGVAMSVCLGMAPHLQTYMFTGLSVDMYPCVHEAMHICW